MSDLRATRERPSVIAIVVTYRRVDLLLRTLSSVVHQSVPISRVVVVDNAADRDLETRLASDLPEIVYIASPENLGPGGGFGVGLRRAEEEPSAADWYWLLDDDSPPASNALELGLEVASTERSFGPIGAIGLRGGHVRHGLIRHDLPAGSVASPTTADFLLVDGSILSAAAVRKAGYPRSDFFIMMEDLEYSHRIGEAGFALIVRPDDGSTNLYQGSGAPWRGYYQCRNHLRLAIERRSPSWVFGWLTRELAINFNHLRKRRWKSIRFRIRGGVDAIRNRMGRRVEPTASS